MPNGTSAPALAAVPGATDLEAEIRNLYNARENIRATLVKTRAAQRRIDADLLASAIREFSGPRADAGADLAVKRVEDANRERAKLNTQEAALQTLDEAVTERIEQLQEDAPHAIAAELLRRRSELERRRATEQADVAQIDEQLAIIDAELKKVRGNGKSTAQRAGRRTRQQGEGAASEVAPSETAADQSAASQTPASQTAASQTSATQTAPGQRARARARRVASQRRGASRSQEVRSSSRGTRTTGRR